ncbi:LacI family DNA-binding transcriptional regulator [Curtobacterium sp. 'Ferrero']|uniref:LacI family DNA-binding transcriptional regulator n=1 Tax=Curtobacterium sp. 'Ferrero' TaxID=2033654 RepID=UPI001144EAD7|nr:LacI family DNA-binding transcriptional regulator [Curtobacterium sp. 'Ferrero']
MTIRRPRRRVALEPFWMQYVRGIEEVLAECDLVLVLQVVGSVEEDLGVLRRWATSGKFAGVIVTDILVDDRRIPALRDLALPAVLVGTMGAESDFTTISTDDAAVAEAIVQHLATHGHRSVARVSGPRSMMHTAVRDRAFASAGAAAGVRMTTVEGDYTAEAGEAGVRALVVEGVDRPTALVFDNDVMALRGLDVLTAAGVRVPDDITVVAWDDSVGCQLAEPALTAAAHDIRAFGADTARAFLDVLGGAPPTSLLAETPTLVVRASSGQSPAGSVASDVDQVAQVSGTEAVR